MGTRLEDPECQEQIAATMAQRKVAARAAIDAAVPDNMAPFSATLVFSLPETSSSLTPFLRCVWSRWPSSA